ncbi:LuxR C-terminal-related transcriptional regulator [Actinocrispum sp. NPDC049592]|uniref:response regulator transcription factor n=1 Tax=Actinocrispum sp. NPDC049592 TaxID=3154835 RepID=UPI003417601B
MATHTHISETTVKVHITHILTKLNLRNRAHAIVYAYESGLIHPGSKPEDDMSLGSGA